MRETERYQRAKAVFFEACEQPEGARRAFVERACADDRELLEQVQVLLAGDEAPLTMMNAGRMREHLGRLADSSAFGRPEGAAPGLDDPSGAPMPSRIGRYRILSRLGEGGMGIVYLAEQDNPRRQVALKIIGSNAASRQMLRRFEHEAQILGRLHHSGIAQVYEAGVHDSGEGGRPYFAMELVRGRMLTRFCDETSAAVRERLRLFIDICEAVQHAHQQGVIHRDLKPANILIDDVSALPKILDFGVARLTDSDVQATTMHTAADQLIGTVAYMSPEQMAGRPEDIDTRSDVFALGVILFELLAGRLPHNVTGKTIPDMIRTISEGEPTTLSAISRTYRGDLETIAGKAMERDKSRRYQSAGELGADVRRYLTSEPIHARPPSTIYQMRKFARRNAALVVGATAVFAALVAGIIATTWQARQAIAARDEQQALREIADDNARLAKAEADKANAVNAFLRRMLASANPDVTQGREVLVSEVLDAAAADLTGGALAGQPDVELQAHMTIAETYRSIGRVDAAMQHLESALRLARSEPGKRVDEEAAALNAVGVIHSIRGDLQLAQRVTDEALRMLEEAHGGQDREDVADCVLNLAEYAANDGQQAVAVDLQRRGLGMLQRLRGESDVGVARTQARLAGMLHNPAEAEPLVRAAIQTFEALGEKHPSHVTALRTLADVITMRGAFDEAEPIYRRALELGTQVYGRDHHRNLLTLANLSFCMRLARRPEAYLETCNELVAMSRRLYGDDNMNVAEALVDRADVLAALGRRDESEADFREAAAITERSADPDDVRGCVARIGVAAAIVDRDGDLQEVEALARSVLKFESQFKGEQRWLIGQAICLLAEVALRRGDLPEAERLYLDGYERLGSSGLVRVHRRAAAAHLVRVYELLDAAHPEQGHAESAAKWRAREIELRPAPAATQPG